MNKTRQLNIERIAETTRENITDYGIPNVFEVAEKLGYRVIRYPIGEDSFLGFSMIRDAEGIIFSNSSTILSREIFTVAHEIGHHKLHLSEQEGKTIIKDETLTGHTEEEIEANYFAACLLMPREKVDKFIRFELHDKPVEKWNGLDIARIQTAFSVSYDMALIRLKELEKLNGEQIERLKQDKAENTASKLLNAIKGNINLCISSDAKIVPAEYLEWAISNYNEKLIPKSSLEAVLNYVDIPVEELNLPPEKSDKDESFDDLLRGVD
ncbi:ImmA/IrrE family metallo-endopeptidase [Sporomusa aerivorans]|uniref:ImmA/IrrE family metallo-endopeptidase n=1 Tax=Sporomusa aerivorans TaxID=204936 RepID=UPI003529DCB7